MLLNAAYAPGRRRVATCRQSRANLIRFNVVEFIRAGSALNLHIYHKRLAKLQFPRFFDLASSETPVL